MSIHPSLAMPKSHVLIRSMMTPLLVLDLCDHIVILASPPFAMMTPHCFSNRSTAIASKQEQTVAAIGSVVSAACLCLKSLRQQTQ
mmetsp:Transcript_33642/g.49858  ORF Transcript_33642/g.49858 Transcript_33642/m.49858 type:complete len:86 (-) Transcript_33642:794-1051(-)